MGYITNSFQERMSILAGFLAGAKVTKVIWMYALSIQLYREHPPPPKLNIAPEKLPSQKERPTSSNHHVFRGSNLLWKTSHKFKHLSEPSFEASFSQRSPWLSVKARSYGPRKRFQMMCGYLGSSVTSGIPITCASEWVSRIAQPQQNPKMAMNHYIAWLIGILKMAHYHPFFNWVV